ncbi:MAG: hypothetical protein C0399_03820 [Syntrophus sp. (in: bacteria)]|nr:hypothetical protein [Syntrophus sp. (in: bacteria)]
MASYLDLLQRVPILQQSLINQKNKSLVVNTANIPFEHLLTGSLKQIEAKSLPAKNILEVDLSVPVNEEEKFKKSLQFVLEKEGTKLVREDGGRESSRFGILQSTARDLGYKGNINDITKGEVEMIYRKFWEKSGAASLPFPLSVVHFDTYINNPASAKRILEKSKGDVDAYLKLREQRYVKLATAKPEVYGKYLRGWKNRIQNLRGMVAAYTKIHNYAGNTSYPIKNS